MANFCKYQTLTLNQIDYSPEINKWLKQFDESDRATAKQLLLRLRFITKDAFSVWLKDELPEITHEKCAIFVVRKLNDTNQKANKKKLTLFDGQGEVIKRPAETLGSEDLVSSIISNFLKDKSKSKIAYDHPSIELMRKEKIRHLILIDDSIGSGNRIVEFIKSMLAHKNFRSWWNFGWIKLTILSYARNKEAEKLIFSKIEQKKNPNKKINNQDKIKFKSAYVYSSKDPSHSWGESYQAISQLCKKVTKVSSNYRLGYDKTFSNIVFLHSVPNNIPGVLFFENQRWKGLMAYRSMPTWLASLLTNDTVVKKDANNTSLTTEMILLLNLAKKGVRLNSSLSLRLGLDSHYIEKLFEQAKKLGLLTSERKLTKYGIGALYKAAANKKLERFNYDLYIPSSWCAG